MPYLNVLSKFRDDIRNEARVCKQFQILNLCDTLRDEILPDLGVLMEDLTDKTIVKISDRETLIREKEQKRLLTEKRKIEELKRKDELEKAKVINIISQFFQNNLFYSFIFH
jgi:cysteinyl-tRNA synthetase